MSPFLIATIIAAAGLSAYVALAFWFRWGYGQNRLPDNEIKSPAGLPF